MTMKMFKRVTIGMVLAGVAIPAMATAPDSAHLAQCKSDLKRVYGEDTRLKLKSIKRSRNGNQMRIKAIVPDSGSHMTTCWVDHDGVTNMQDKNGVALVAPSFDSGDKVSQND
jgi:hypothetical protein